MLGKKPEIHPDLWAYFSDVQDNWCARGTQWIADGVISCAALVESIEIFILILMNEKKKKKKGLPVPATWASRTGVILPALQIKSSLSRLIFRICEMETIAFSFVLPCPEELEWARPFRRTLKIDYCFSLLCATLPTMKCYLRIKVQICLAKKWC